MPSFPLRTRGAALALALLCTCLGSSTASAQRPEVRRALEGAGDTVMVAVLTRDGSRYVGRVRSTDAEGLVLDTEAGSLTLRWDRVRGAEVPAGSDAGWFPHPNPSRMLFAPTGRTLSRGDKVIAVHELLFPSLTLGITDRVELGGGVSLFPGLSAREQLFYVMPRVAVVRRPTVNVAAGALVMHVSHYDDFVDDPQTDVPTLGMLYGSGTIGGPDANLSAGLGWGFVGSELASTPVVTMSGEWRVASRMSFIGEAWNIPSETTLFGVGLRFLSRNVSFDAAALSSGDAGGYVFPFIGVAMGF